MAKSSNPIDIIKSKKIEPDFEPSTKTLSRIVKRMITNGNKGRTELSTNTNLNYARLAKHIVWMEQKGLVESTIDESKIKVGLTEKGKKFASIFVDD